MTVEKLIIGCLRHQVIMSSYFDQMSERFIVTIIKLNYIKLYQLMIE